jgi:hypothetical protein
MRHCSVPAIGPVTVILFVPAAFVIRSALRSIGAGLRDRMLVHGAARDVVEMAVVEVIHVPVVVDGGMTALGAMYVRMRAVFLMPF